MRINGALHRVRWTPRSQMVRVHLGPGQKKYLQGWINVDGNLVSAKCDVWADLRAKLPFPDASVDVFYSFHVIEHLPDSLLPFHLAEMFRCLKPGGGIRIGGPNGDMAARKLVEGDRKWFSDFPDRRESVGGAFANFILCRGEHLTILTESYLRELLEQAGFTVNVKVCIPGSETTLTPLIDEAVLGTEAESSPSEPHSIVLEARKPSVLS